MVTKENDSSRSSRIKSKYMLIFVNDYYIIAYDYYIIAHIPSFRSQQKASDLNNLLHLRKEH